LAKWDRWETNKDADDQGGQARIYFVIDNFGQYEGEYALKEFKNINRIERFRTEISVISKLKNHTNVISLIDSGKRQKKCKQYEWYVMEKADDNLNRYLSKENYDIEVRFQIFEQICEGVAHLHESKIIHRDIKPENILVFSGIPKIADFGLALIAEAPRHTMTSEAVGPRLYMAPELEDGKNLDVSCKADVYSLGKLLYYVLSGGKIFAREKYKESDWNLTALFKDDRFGIFDSIFDKSITENVSQRYENARGFKIAFQEVCAAYRKNPKTILYDKFGTIDASLIASNQELESLDLPEWKEIFTFIEKNNSSVSEKFLKSAYSALTYDFSLHFTRVLLKNKQHLTPEFIVQALKKVLCSEYISLFYAELINQSVLELFLLTQDYDSELLNSIAKLGFSVLNKNPIILDKLSKNYSFLNDDAKKSFILASYNSDFPNKEQRFISLSYDENINDLFLEAIVAGLCKCDTQTALQRVIELADIEMPENKLSAVIRGLTLGSSYGLPKEFKERNWKNSVINMLFELEEENTNTEEIDDEN
jgi:serine/threonine protein kinase